MLYIRSERLLQGLWCFPMIEGNFSAEELKLQAEKKFSLPLDHLQEAGTARHVFSHRIWNMRLYTAGTEESSSVPAGYSFVPVNELKALALPAAMNAAVSVLTRQS